MVGDWRNLSVARIWEHVGSFIGCGLMSWTILQLHPYPQIGDQRWAKYAELSSGPIIIVVMILFCDAWLIHCFFRLKDKTTPDEVIVFLEEHNAPLVGQYGRMTKDKIYKNKRPLVMFFYTVDWSFDHRDGNKPLPFSITCNSSCQLFVNTLSFAHVFMFVRNLKEINCCLPAVLQQKTP